MQVIDPITVLVSKVLYTRIHIVFACWKTPKQMIKTQRVYAMTDMVSIITKMHAYNVNLVISITKILIIYNSHPVRNVQ